MGQYNDENYTTYSRAVSYVISAISQILNCKTICFCSPSDFHTFNVTTCQSKMCFFSPGIYHHYIIFFIHKYPHSFSSDRLFPAAAVSQIILCLSVVHCRIQPV